MSDTNYWKVMCALLFGIVIIFMAYLGNSYYGDRVTDIYDEGYYDGGIEIIQILIDRALKCETIPLGYTQNETLNLLAIECLPQEVIEYLQQGVQNG